MIIATKLMMLHIRLLFVLSIIYLVQCQSCNRTQIGSQTTYYVAVKDNDCTESIKNNCHTLRFYVTNKSTYFQDDTEFIFLPGEYNLDANSTLQVWHVSNLSLRGQNATLQCHKSNIIFAFHHVNSLLIENLIFHECGIKETRYLKGKATLAINYGIDLILMNVTITKSLFQGLYVDNTLGNVSLNGVIIRDCHTNTPEIVSNRTANIFYFSQCPQNLRTYMHIENSKFKGNSNAGFDNFTTLHSKDESYDFAAGLTLVIKCDNVEALLHNIEMDRNRGGHGGNLALVFHTPCLWKVPPVVIQDSVISNGGAIEGGGVFVSIVQPFISGNNFTNMTIINGNHTILHITRTKFIGNSAKFLGGAVSIRQKESLIFDIVGNIEISNCVFENNSLERGGHGAIAINSINFISTETSFHVSPQFRTFVQNCSFSHNFVKKNKWKASGSAVIFVKTNPFFKMSNVVIDSNNSTAILGLESNLVLNGNITLSNNFASSGGGFLLCQNAVLFLEPGVVVTIFDNYAEHNGGGIAVESVCLISEPICFFQLADSNPKYYDEVHINMYNNTANYAGDNLYGGYVEYCYMIENTAHNTSANKSMSVYKTVFNIEPQGPGLPSVTSPPTHVCLCERNSPNCSITQYHKPEPVYPGQQFSIELILVGQLDGTVPGIIQAHVLNEGHEIECKPNYRHYSETHRCQNFNYTFSSRRTSRNATLNIEAAQQGDTSVSEHLEQFRGLRITIDLTECPIGFQLSSTLHRTSTCVCDTFFRNHSISNCSITDNTIVSPPNIWIGYIINDNNSTDFVPSGYLLATEICPAEYCKQCNVKLDFSDVFGQNKQCLKSRGGILCGKCVEGSVMLGGAYCGECSNWYLLLLLLFALAGIILVLLVTALNITVADGTMNGLIFYAHIVQSQNQLIFGNIHSNIWKSFYTIFIAWFNLELGIKTCFFNGMTEYHKAWLQFMFPLYIWFILGVIVLLSRRFNLVTRLVGRNAVKVFATLILLSYPKLFRALIAAMDFTVLNVSNGESHIVWTIDGNVRFLQGKHIALFVFSAILAIVCFPFTLSLLFVQILERFSHYKIFCFMRRFKPLYDAYTGPYSKNARFWTGFLLLVRITIFITSIFNGRDNANVNILVVIAITIVIFFLSSVIRLGIYKKLGLNILECFSMLNLGLLFVALAFSRFHNKKNVSPLIHMSVMSAFVLLIGVVIFHICQKLYSFQYIKDVCARIKEVLKQKFKFEHLDTRDNISRSTDNYPPFIRFDQDREPLLAGSKD